MGAIFCQHHKYNSGRDCKDHHQGHKTIENAIVFGTQVSGHIELEKIIGHISYHTEYKQDQTVSRKLIKSYQILSEKNSRIDRYYSIYGDYETNNRFHLYSLCLNAHKEDTDRFAQMAKIGRA